MSIGNFWMSWDSNYGFLEIAKTEKGYSVCCTETSCYGHQYYNTYSDEIGIESAIKSCNVPYREREQLKNDVYKWMLEQIIELKGA